MKKYLCTPCAEKIKGCYKAVTPYAGRREKVLCAECDRKRFGLMYEVVGHRRKVKENVHSS